jgi:cytochrome c oxidase subunit 2
MTSRQSALDPAGAASREIAGLTWFFVALLGTIFAIVMTIAIWAILRRNRGPEEKVLEQTHNATPQADTKLMRAVTVGSSITFLILIGLIILSISKGSVSHQRIGKGDPLVIEVTGNQWWWHIRYLNDDASRIVVTANEIHIPVGRPILIRGTSNDVIHSFWVPNLQGKRDLIPSRVTTIWLQANQPGRFRGQCAEFCGLGHARMALWVVAEHQDQFDSWFTHQLQPATSPSDPVAQRGEQVFLGLSCILCHSIRGTTAAGQVAPDLTHLASRLTIAAGTLPNTKGNLAGWLADPQNVKPGNHMATIQLKSQDMQPLIEYLAGLQ